MKIGLFPAELLRLLGGIPSELEFARMAVPVGRLAEAEMLEFLSDAEDTVDKEATDPVADPLTVGRLVELMDGDEIEEGETRELFPAMEPFVNGSSRVPHTAAGLDQL